MSPSRSAIGRPPYFVGLARWSRGARSGRAGWMPVTASRRRPLRSLPGTSRIGQAGGGGGAGEGVGGGGGGDRELDDLRPAAAVALVELLAADLGEIELHRRIEPVDIVVEADDLAYLRAVVGANHLEHAVQHLLDG